MTERPSHADLYPRAGGKTALAWLLASDTPPDALFDLDNCLIRCTEAYAQQNRAFADFLCDRFPGLPLDEALKVFDDVEQKNREALGVHPDRYPTSMVETLELFAGRRGVMVDESDRDTARAIAQVVFDYDYPPYPGAIEVLQALRAAGCRIALCTKGERDVQERKVDRWGLRPLFDHIEAVPKKTASSLRDAHAALQPEGRPDFAPRVFMVGDSLRDDIVSAHDAGFVAIHVPYVGPKGWSYEEGFDHVIPHARVPSVAYLGDALPLPALQAIADRHRRAALTPESCSTSSPSTLASLVAPATESVRRRFRFPTRRS